MGLAVECDPFRVGTLLVWFVGRVPDAIEFVAFSDIKRC
jgi:hypothetical protein